MMFKNERDIECPELIKFITTRNVRRALDVGARYSWQSYAPHIRQLLSNYDAIDIIPDEKTKGIVDHYIIGNVAEVTLPQPQYELVFSISTIEHSGISTYKKPDWSIEQINIFLRINALAQKYIFVTFPYGKPCLHEGEFANITPMQLDKFLYAVKSYKTETKFYYTHFCMDAPFHEINKSEADEIEYRKEFGTRCICILTVEK